MYYKDNGMRLIITGAKLRARCAESTLRSKTKRDKNNACDNYVIGSN
jgi:hypothetical protein